MRSIQLFFIFAFSTFAASAQLALSVSPARVFFDVNAKEKTKQLQLHNTGSASTSWQVYIQDWDRDQNGKKRYFQSGSLDNSLSKQLKVYPETITIDSGGIGVVNVVLNENYNLTPNDTATNAMIMITQIGNFSADKSKPGLHIMAEFAIHIYAVNNKAHKSINFQDFKVNPKDPGELTMKLVNDGLLPLDAKINVDITNTENGKVYKIEDLGSSILPGDSRYSDIKLPEEIGKGKFIALAVVDIGNAEDIKVAELKFELK